MQFVTLKMHSHHFVYTYHNQVQDKNVCSYFGENGFKKMDFSHDIRCELHIIPFLRKGKHNTSSLNTCKYKCQFLAVKSAGLSTYFNFVLHISIYVQLYIITGHFSYMES